MTIDWTQFRDGDRVRVTFEGVWTQRQTHPSAYLASDGGHNFYETGTLRGATFAEVIERPFTPPAAGKLFRVKDSVFISLGDIGFRGVRSLAGNPWTTTDGYAWGTEDRLWLDQIEVLDV